MGKYQWRTSRRKSMVLFIEFAIKAYIFHWWSYCSGTYGGSTPLRKESNNISALSGWEDGTMWPAPLTEANVNPPLYCWTYPPTCKHKHQTEFMSQTYHKLLHTQTHKHVDGSEVHRTHLHVYCPRTPWGCDAKFKIVDGKPRGGKRAHRIKIAAEIFLFS